MWKSYPRNEAARVYIGSGFLFFVGQPGLRWNICPGLLRFVGRVVGCQGRVSHYAFIGAQRKPFTAASAGGMVFGFAVGWGMGEGAGRGKLRYRGFPTPAQALYSFL